MKARDPDELDRLRSRFPSLAEYSDDDLPALWAATMLCMRDRGLVRGHGSVPGEFAEHLVARWYDVDLGRQSTPDVDVTTVMGRRIQVKAVRYTDPGRASVAAFSRPINFEELAIVRFEYDMRVRDALLLESSLLCVAQRGSSGLLTPRGKRLSLGPRVEAAAVCIPGEDLLQRGHGRQRDAQEAGKA